MTRNKCLAVFLLISACLIPGCAPSIAADQPNNLLFVLVTSAPNPSPTPTPFQPSSFAAQPIPTISLSDPIVSQALPTETPSPAPIPIASPTATVDINLLFPTSAAPPIADSQSAEPTALAPLVDEARINFLLIGSDLRQGSSFRTDTILIAIIWPNEGQVSLISIPRDLWVYIPTVGMQRINTAYQSGEVNGYAGGGAALLKDTITYNLGITIDHTAMVDFDGFRRIINTLGGIEVPIACPYTDWRLIDPSYDPYNENNWWLYTVGPGQVHMDGDLALWYARSRSKSNDFDRGRRQQEVIRSIFDQALQTSIFGKIPQLYNDLSSAVLTDIGLTDTIRLAPHAMKFTNANIRGYYIRPPYVVEWTTPAGAMVLLPNEAEIQVMLTEATTLSSFASERQVIKVDVQNGTAQETWEALAAERLNYAGYQTSVSNSDRRDYNNSVLIDYTILQDPNQRQAVISALNLNSPSIISQPDEKNGVQYRVIIGTDYVPCFKPQDLSH